MMKMVVVGATPHTTLPSGDNGMPLYTDRRSVVSLTVVVTLLVAACTHWGRTSPPYEKHLQPDDPHRVRIQLTDGSQIILDSARVERDSLIGQVELSGPTGEEDGQSVRTALPLSRVHQLEIRRVNVGGTVLLVAAGALIVGTSIAAAASEQPAPADSIQTCPLAYSWDGEAWRLDSGTFGGAIMAPLARTQVDRLAHLRPEDGEARVRVSSELDETDMVDEVKLIAVDHPPGTIVAPDREGRIRGLHDPVPPVAARDDWGRDVLGRVTSADGRSWTSVVRGRDTARVADLRSGVELFFVRPPDAAEARLVVDGRNSYWAAALLTSYVAMHGRGVNVWYDSVNTDSARARRFGELLARAAFLRAEIETPTGWVATGAVQEAGPEVMRRQVVLIDLADVRGDTVRVRLTSTPSFWEVDWVAMDFGPEPSPSVQPFRARRAVDQDGRDVSELLAAVDEQHFVGEKGDRVDLVFDVPPVPEGKARSYALATSGWYRIHTPAVGEAEVAALDRLESDPTFVAKYAVSRMNAALLLLASARP